MRLVGIDCATVNRKTGLAFADFSGGIVTIEECLIADPVVRIADQIQARLPKECTVLIALDAPLGWPAAFGTNIYNHKAGRPILTDSDSLFRRATDLLIKERLKKVPLEVATNFIARTAVSALKLIADLSKLNNTIIPLAWKPPETVGVFVIEVYPAGTLRAYETMGFVQAGETSLESKDNLLKKLQHDGRLRFGSGAERAIENKHVTDAILCCVAALDFLENKVMQPSPQDMDKATKEGWIWVRDPAL